MRDSFGGAFMLNMALVFIVVYIAFLAVAINYAKAFRVKNNVINILEQYQYSGGSNEIAIRKVEDYLPEVAYNMAGNNKVEQHCYDQASNPVFIENGVCIINESGNSDPKYFRVITYISIDFPFFNIHLTVPVSGETKSIYN